VRFSAQLSPVNAVAPSPIWSEMLLLVSSATILTLQTENSARAKLVA